VSLPPSPPTLCFSLNSSPTPSMMLTTPEGLPFSYLQANFFPFNFLSLFLVMEGPPTPLRPPLHPSCRSAPVPTSFPHDSSVRSSSFFLNDFVRFTPVTLHVQNKGFYLFLYFSPPQTINALFSFFFFMANRFTLPGGPPPHPPLFLSLCFSYISLVWLKTLHGTASFDPSFLFTLTPQIFSRSTPSFLLRTSPYLLRCLSEDFSLSLFPLLCYHFAPLLFFVSRLCFSC